MKKKLKHSLYIAALPAVLLLGSLSTSFANNSAQNINLVDETNHVKKAGSKSPSIAFYNNKYQVNNTDVTLPTSGKFTQVPSISKRGDQITFSIYSKNQDTRKNFFDVSNLNIQLKFYSYSLTSNNTYTRGEELTYSPLTYSFTTSMSADNNDQLRNYTLTLNTLTDFAFSLSSEGNDTYAAFETLDFVIKTGKKTQTGVYVVNKDDLSNRQIDGGSFEIVYSGSDIVTQFRSIKDADGLISTGSEKFSLRDIHGDNGDNIFITDDGILTVKKAQITAKLIFTKQGDSEYDDLTFAISLTILSQLETPATIFESNGQSNLHNTLYNLVPGAYYTLYYTKTYEDETVEKFHTDFIALDGSNVLSTDPEVDSIFNSTECVNKGYYVVDENQSVTMAGATITGIERRALSGQENIYSTSNKQETNYYVLKRKPIPRMYDSNVYTNGIRYDDSDGLLINLNSATSYEVTYYLRDDSTRLLTFVATVSEKSTTYDLASYLPQGAILKSIAVRGTSSTENVDCRANSFSSSLNGTIYSHADSISGINYDRFNSSLITSIKNLEPNTPYKLFTKSLKGRDSITITSDSNGAISLMNHNNLGVSEVDDNGLTYGGLEITAIKRIGNLQSEDVNDKTSNSVSLNLDKVKFVALDTYKDSLITNGIARVDKLGEAALKANGRAALNEKQIRAMDSTKAKINLIELKNASTTEIQKQIDLLIDDLAVSINTYVGVMGYLAGIEGWVYIAVAIGLFLILVAVIFLYRAAKRKYEKISIKILERFACVSPLPLIALYSFNSVGGNFFAPIIIMIEIVFIAIFLALTFSYLRKAGDLKRWKRFHDDEGQILESALTKRERKKLEKQEKKLVKVRKLKEEKAKE